MIKSNSKLMQIIGKIESSLSNIGYKKNNKEITGDSPVFQMTTNPEGGTIFRTKIEIPDTNDMTQTFILSGEETEMTIRLVMHLIQPQLLNHEQVEIIKHYATFFGGRGIGGYFMDESDENGVYLTSNLNIAYNERDDILFEKLIPAMIENMRSYHSLIQGWMKNMNLIDLIR